MTHKIGNLISVIFVWALVAYIFVFGFARMEWSSWEVGLPWLAGVTFMFVSAGFTSKCLMYGPSNQQQ